MADEVDQSSSPEEFVNPIASENILIDDATEAAALAAIPKMLIVCKWCSEEKIKTCLKCSSTYCSNHASRISPALCKECFKGIALILDQYIKTESEYNTTTDTMITRKESCDRLRLDGPDWVWYTLWIHTLNDDELKLAFEFHRFVVSMLENANETRKISKARKLAAMPAPVSVTTTTTTSTKKVSKQKDMRAELKKIGMSDDMIEIMLKAAGQK